jgi:ribonucleoside-triphosphate reductase (formate)
MLGLTKDQIADKITFIEDYIGAENAASGSLVDANANITQKNLATLQYELFKNYSIQVNRALVYSYIKERFGEGLAAQYLQDLKEHIIYTHDETSLNPYCCSISLYPFLLDGMTKLGGESQAPKHLESFVGSFTNLVFAVASQVAGAVATVEFLLYFSYFAKKDFGEKWLETKCNGKLDQYFQSVVYALNQPATARGFQSVFWNISIFDEHFFKSLFGEFFFPDGSQISWEEMDVVQRYFVSWFREERKKTILTFPIITLSALSDPENKTWKDQQYLKFASKEYEQGSEFFIYTSPTVDSLSSCCRLRNALQDHVFSYSLGAGGVMTGSKNVITLNVNRIVQKGIVLSDVVERVHQYQIGFNDLYKWYAARDMLSIVNAGFVNLDKLYLTVGLNGVVEAAEFLGYAISDNPEYKNWVKGLFSTIKNLNHVNGKKYGVLFNTELVPAENLGVKNAAWDKKAGLKVNRDCYNSYLYVVEDSNTSIIDKLNLHGGEILENLDGGSAVHFNNNERLTKAQYRKLFEALVVSGSNYFCENVPKTCCTNKDCGYIHPNRADKCPKCGAEVEYATRVIGYLKKVSSFHKQRQTEENKRYYHT